VTGDRVIRSATTAVVCAVAAFAAVVSYSHIYGPGPGARTGWHGGPAAALSVDGLILAASLVLLHEARNDRDAPGLARLMLWLGIGATIGANIAYGAGYGLLGELISAWPAVAFIGAVEIAMQLVRRARGPQVAEIVPDMPGNAEQAVRAAYAASVAAGQPLSQRAMAERFGLPRRKVSQLVTQEIDDPAAFLAAIRQQLAGQVDELTDELAGDDRPGEGYLGKAGRLTAARHQAEEIIRHEHSPLTSDDEDDGDESASAGERPPVIGRTHPSWAEVDAEQQERLGDPPGKDSQS
jgi:hypothetical protein